MTHYYAIIDFECTCWENQESSKDPKYPHEIIEFPVVFLNSGSLQIEFEFHAYVKPVEQPILSSFCTELTGITQSIVDCAKPLGAVLNEFDQFLIENRITHFTTTSDGPWDFHRFLYPETNRKGLKYPKWGSKWLDIRQRFEKDFKLEKWVGVNQMLAVIGLEFEGREHSGIDDARNIANIVSACHKRSISSCGSKMRPNRCIKQMNSRIVKRKP